MVRKSGLGKGLDAILPDDIASDFLDEVPSGERLREIDISEIFPNPMQPRSDFDPSSLEQLAQSIRQQGVLQPIIVARSDSGYILVAGERRWRAAKMAKLEKIPAIVLEQKPDEQQLLFIALVENLQREDLDPVEEAEAYYNLSKNFGLTQDEIARRVGKSRSTVANFLRILKLPEPVIKLLREKKITFGHALVLLEEKDEKRQIRLAQLAARRGISVERLGVIVMGKKKKQKRSRAKKNPKILAMEDELSVLLGTKVEIFSGKKKGKIVIEYYSEKDLHEIVKKLSE